MPKDEKRYLPIEVSGRLAEALKEYRAAKDLEAEARQRVDDLKAEILELVWVDGDEESSGTEDMLDGVGAAGMELGGLVRISHSRPARFDAREFDRDHPGLRKQYYAAGSLERRITVL